jgi:hypothetical protein
LGAKSINAQNYQYSFNNGTVVNDLGTGNDGSISTPTFTGYISDNYGNANKAVQNTATAFGGVDCGDVTFLNSNTDFTLTFWFKFYTPTSPNSNRSIVKKGSNFNIYLGFDNKMHAIIGGTDYWNSFFSPISINSSSIPTPHFISVVKSGSNLSIRYANTLGTLPSISIANVSTATASPAVTGSILQFLNACDGAIDDVFLSSTAYSQTQVDSIMNRFNPVNPKEEASYSFNNANCNNDLGSNLNGIADPGVSYTSDRFGNSCQAINLQGSPEHVMINNLTTIDTTDQLTISGWCKKLPNNISQTIFQYGNLRLEAYGAGSSYLYASNGNSNSTTASNPSIFSTIPVGTWFHFACVYTTSEIILYVNGQLFATKSLLVPYYRFAPTKFYIGANPNSSYSSYASSIDDIYIVNRALSLSQIDSLKNLPNPNQIATCPTDIPTWIKYSFNNGNANNEVANINNGTAIDAYLVATDRFGNANKAYDFGTNGFGTIDCGNISAINYGRQLTFSGWYVKPANGVKRYLFTQSNGSGGFYGAYLENDGTHVYGQSGTQTTGLVASSSVYTNIPTGNWFHFAMVMDSIGGVNTLKVFINGTLYAENTNLTSFINGGSYMYGADFFLGQNIDGNAYGQNWQGYIDDIHITDQALTLAQIDSLRNLPNPVTPAPMSPINWVKYSFNSGNANNDVAPIYNGVVTGATLTTDRFGNANQAYDFGTTGTSKIDCGDIAMMNNGKHLTIAGWFEMPSTSANRELFCKGTSTSSILRTRTYTDGVGLYGYSGSQYTGAPINTTFLSIPSGSWFHYALVIDSTNSLMKTYLNGVLFSQGNLSSYVNSTSSFLLGNAASSISNNEGWRGKMDDIFIVNRALTINQIDSLRNLPNPGNTTSLNSNEFNNNQIILYPNPANDYININLLNLINSEILRAEIINALGEVVLTQDISQNNNQIKVSSLNSGVYFIKIKGSKNYIKKFIKE